MQLNCKIGVDIVFIPRMQDKIVNDKFLNKVLTKNERLIFDNLQSERRKLEFLSGRFAAKEACSKALGYGIGKEFDFLDIEILKDEHNAPILKGLNGQVSIAHDNDYAIANVIINIEKEVK